MSFLYIRRAGPSIQRGCNNYFSSTTATATATPASTKPFTQHQEKRKITRATFLATTTVLLVSLSMYNRSWKKQKLQELLPATDERDWTAVAEMMERAGLMGTERSVGSELDFIRKWHEDHGYKGGLVLREYEKPLYTRYNVSMGGGVPGYFSDHNTDNNKSSRNAETSNTNNTNIINIQRRETKFDKNGVEIMDKAKRERRECYYLYYEVMGDGRISQQIFVRGTTLLSELNISLKSVYVYDNDLNCKIHLGFKEHAERILNDVEPLLISPEDPRSTIEISGHSLGGAVALVLALKMAQRGYNVKKVLSIAAPKITDATSVQTLNQLLPLDTLQVSNIDDVINYLPPYGCHVGDKLMLMESKEKVSAYFIPNAQRKQHRWSDNFVLNTFLLDLFRDMPHAHRVYTYKNRLKTLIPDSISSSKD